MATIKICTDIHQSKVLAGILPHDSADMLWEQHGAEPYVTIKPYTTVGKSIGCRCLECWSLAALLGVLPNGIIMHKDSQNGKYHFSSAHIGTYVTADNPVDACVEMILKLHEQKIL